jgi:hypothetical protein
MLKATSDTLLQETDELGATSADSTVEPMDSKALESTSDQDEVAVKSTSRVGGLQADNTIVWEDGTDVEFHNIANVPCALLDTRFLPGRIHANHHLTDSRLRNVFDAIQKSNFWDKLKVTKLWTFIAYSEDAAVVRQSLDSIFCDKKGFSIVEAYYRPHPNEHSPVSDTVKGSCTRPLLVLLHALWPQANETLKRIHVAEDLPRYLFPQMIEKERECAVFKEELRIQAYMDIVGQMANPGATFLNICGGSKPHLIAKVLP